MKTPTVQSATKITDYNDPIVNFNSNMAYGCSVNWNKASLKDFCTKDTATYLKQFQLFNNVDTEFKMYGKFGNANLYNIKDWSKVKEDPSYAKLGTAVWNDKTKTCSIYSSVLVKVVYDTLGFSENPQNYVKDVVKYAVLEDWKYPDTITDATREIAFNHFVNVQYVNTGESAEDENGLIQSTGFEFSTNMFYPAFIRMMGGATRINAFASSMLMGASALLLAIHS